MVMENMEDRHAMEAADEGRTRGIIEMPTTISDLPQAGGAKAVPKAYKRRL